MTNQSLSLSHKALIFDCDGTIADTLPLHFQAWAATLQSFGADISQDWYFQNCGTSAIAMIQRLNQQFGYQLAADAVNTARQQYYRQLIPTVKPIRAIADIVQMNYGELPLAVASGGEQSIVEATLKAVGLRPFFQTVVSIDQVNQGKPAPDLFLLAAQQLGVAPGDCLVYEDSPEGLEAAQRAGMTAIDVQVLQRTRTRYQGYLGLFYHSEGRIAS